ncbi:hypothetical protein FKM82_026774 [Ascaphus truei]
MTACCGGSRHGLVTPVCVPLMSNRPIFADTELMQPPGDPPPSLFHELPAAACRPATSDPANLLEMFIDDMYPASLTTEAAARSDGAAGETGRRVPRVTPSQLCSQSW